MTIPIPQFNIGDTAYVIGTTTAQKQHPCPDCLGARKWSATSPAGKTYDMPCPRCSNNFSGSMRDLSLDYTAHVPHVEQITIWTVRTDTSKPTGENVEYMTTTTGSGSIYHEKRLRRSKELAEEASRQLANRRNQEVEWIKKQYDRSLSIAMYQLSDAKMVDADRRVRMARCRLAEIKGGIERADDLAELRAWVAGEEKE